MRKRAQVSLEYMVLLGGALLFIVLVTVFLRTTFLSTGQEQLENKSAEFLSYLSQTLTGATNATPTPTITPTPTPIPEPSVSNVILNSTSGGNTTSENLTLYFSQSNAITNITDWRINSNSIATLNMPFENRSNAATVAKDYSTNGNNGTVANGATWTGSGYRGGAYVFDGTDDAIQLGNVWVAQSNPNPVTIAAWVNLSGVVDWGTLYDSGGCNAIMFDAYTDTNPTFTSRYFTVRKACVSNIVSGSTLWNANAWNHVAFSINGTHARVYLNGVPDSAWTALPSLSESTSSDYIGTYNNGEFGLSPDGKIDEFVIYNRSLSDQQIMALYNNRTDLIVSQELVAGEVWSAAVTPNNGTIDGAMVVSNNLTVVSSVPSVSSVILNSTSGTNTTSENLTLHFSQSNAITNITDWRINSNSMAILNMPFEGGSNSTWTRDYSTFANNGTVSGASWSSTGGYNGLGAYLFNGASDYISVPHASSQDIRENLTLAAWIKKSGECVGNCVIVLKQISGDGSTDANLRYGLVLYDPGVGQNRVTFSFNRGAWQDVVVTSTVLLDDTWYSIVGTYDGATARIYVNGILDNSAPTTGEILSSSSGSIEIGRQTGVGAEYFNGSIDDVRVYNRSLSAEQVRAIYEDRNDLIVSQETGVDEVWSVAVTPNNGTVDGATVLSNNLTITAAVPLVSSVVLNSSSGTNTSSENLTLYFTQSNAVTNVTDWTIGGTSIAVLNMPFENQSSPTLARDYSTFGNNGTAVNGAYSTSAGRKGYGYVFDGVNDYVAVNDAASLDLTANFSIVGWIKTTKASDAIFSHYDSGSPYAGFAFAIGMTFGGPCTTPGALSFWSSVEGSWVCGGAAVNDGNWYHVAATFNGSLLKLYKDGALTYSTALAAPGVSSNSAYVGATGDLSSSYLYDGTIDELQVYNRTLSAEQIAVLYQGRDNLIVSQETEAGEAWRAAVTPNNGTGDGSTVLSNTLTIASPLSAVFFLDTNSTHWGQGVFHNTTFYGVGIDANVTLWDPPAVNVSEQNGYWKFDNNSDFGENNTLVFDYTGLGSNASCSGSACPVYANGKFGNAMSFDGNDYLTSTDSMPTGNPAMSVEAWTYTTSLSGSYFIIEWGGYPTDGQGFQLALSSTYGVAASYFGGSCDVLPSLSSYVSNNRWNHILVTKASGSATINFYINGQLRASQAPSCTPGIVNGVFNIGRTEGGANYFNGLIDNLVVYNRTLSATEVSERYNRGSAQLGSFERILDAGSTANWGSINWTTSIAYQQEVSANGSSQVGYWKFNNASAFGENDTRAFDYSGNGNNGTINGAAYVAGKFGRAMSFDGISNNVNLGTSSALNPITVITIEAWVYPQDAGGIEVFIGRDDASLGRSYIVHTGYPDDGKLGSCLIWVGGGFDCFQATSPYSANNWYHVAVTYNKADGVAYFYQNGVMQSSIASTLDLGTTTGPTTLGYRTYSGLENWFHGYLDNVIIYNRTLAASEVLDHYKQGILNITFQTATSNNNVSYSAFSSVYYANQSNGISIEGANSRYLKYLVNFSTEDTRYSPLLQSVAVNST